MITPVLPIFEDYFVNGLYYGDSPLFVGPVDKPRHYAAFEVYFGENSSFWSNESSWGQIRSAVSEMFSRDSKLKGKISSNTIVPLIENLYPTLIGYYVLESRYNIFYLLFLLFAIFIITLHI